ncbi:MAG: hypothetical protein ACM3QW_09430 [Ignavibacteriales bacterium]
MKEKLRWITIMLATLVIGLFLFAPDKSESPPRKPTPDRQVPQWYLINKASHQMSTAYVEPLGAPVSASARPYFLGSVAVHPKIPGGSHLDPIIPFGTIIHLSDPQTLTIQGNTYNAFTVLDTGDANWSLWPDSPYWLDFYFGTDNYWNRKAASDYGKHFIDYYWYEPLK